MCFFKILCGMFDSKINLITFKHIFTQASTSAQIIACVWSVTAILWEQCNLVVKARMDSVSVLIPQWEEDAVTNVVRTSLDLTLVWEGRLHKISLMLVMKPCKYSVIHIIYTVVIHTS